MMKKLYSILTLVLTLGTATAQDPHFTQSFSTPLYLNPGFTGARGCLGIDLADRLQWPGIPGTFHTSYAGVDQYLHALRGGVGLQYMMDIAGDEGQIRTQTFSFSYAPHVQLFDGGLVLKPGIQAGLYHKMVDYSKLNFGDMLDPRRGFVYGSAPTGKGRATAFDLSAGILLYSNKYYGGVAVHHLNEPNTSTLESISKLPMKFSMNIGTRWQLGPELFMLPTVVYVKQQDFHYILPELNFFRKNIMIGTAWMINSSITFSAGYVAEKWRLRYSYDYMIGELDNQSTGGSHELTFSLNFYCKKSDEKIKFWGYLPHN